MCIYVITFDIKPSTNNKTFILILRSVGFDFSPNYVNVGIRLVLIYNANAVMRPVRACPATGPVSPNNACFIHKLIILDIHCIVWLTTQAFCSNAHKLLCITINYAVFWILVINVCLLKQTFIAHQINCSWEPILILL